MQCQTCNKNRNLAQMKKKGICNTCYHKKYPTVRTPKLINLGLYRNITKVKNKYYIEKIKTEKTYEVEKVKEQIQERVKEWGWHSWEQFKTELNEIESLLVKFKRGEHRIEHRIRRLH